MKILNEHLFHKITLCCSRSIYTGDRRKGCMAPGRPICPKLRSVMLIMAWQQQCSPLPALHTPSTLSFACPPSCSSCSVSPPPPFFTSFPAAAVEWNDTSDTGRARSSCPTAGADALSSLHWNGSTVQYDLSYCISAQRVTLSICIRARILHRWKKLTVVSTEVSLGG